MGKGHWVPSLKISEKAKIPTQVPDQLTSFTNDRFEVQRFLDV